MVIFDTESCGFTKKSTCTDWLHPGLLKCLWDSAPHPKIERGEFIAMNFLWLSDKFLWNAKESFSFCCYKGLSPCWRCINLKLFFFFKLDVALETNCLTLGLTFTPRISFYDFNQGLSLWSSASSMIKISRRTLWNCKKAKTSFEESKPALLFLSSHTVL